MKFSNGEPVTAKDFVYSFSRILDPATKSPVVSFWSGVAGAAAYAKNPTGAVSGIKAVSDTKLEIKLTAPNSTFKYVLAMPHASVIRTARRGPGDQAGRFGTVHAVRVHPRPADRGQPQRRLLGLAAALRRPGRREARHRPAGPGAGAAEGSDRPDGRPDPAGDYLQVTTDPSLKDQLVTIIKPSTYFLTMNMKKTPFDNPKVREAVSYAFDRTFLLQLVNGQGSVANEFLPPGIAGYSTDKMVHAQDIAKAQAAARRGRLPERSRPRSVLVEHAAVDRSRPADPAGPRQDRYHGERQGRDPAERILRARRHPDKSPMTVTFWVADYPDGVELLRRLLSCAAAIPGGQNYPFYCNKNVDDLVNKALAASTTPTRTPLYDQATKAMLADNPVVPLYYGSKTEVFGKNVGGYHSQPIWGWDMTNYWKPTGTARQLRPPWGGGAPPPAPRRTRCHARIGAPTGAPQPTTRARPEVSACQRYSRSTTSPSTSVVAPAPSMQCAVSRFWSSRANGSASLVSPDPASR